MNIDSPNGMPRLQCADSTRNRLSVSLALFVGMLICGSNSYAKDDSVNATQTLAPPRPHLLLLATGGTIAGSADSRGNGAYNSGALNAQQLINAVPGLGDLAVLSSEQIANVGSQDMSDAIWIKLAKRIQLSLDQSDVNGVVVTHGTDTLEETAFFLNLVLKSQKPVIMVGSMRPATSVSADGPGNILQAVEVAIDKQSANRGVLVVMNEQIDSARGVTKTHSTSVQTMQSPTLGSVGSVVFGHVRYAQPASPIRTTPLSLPLDDKLPRVEIVFGHSNMDGKQIEHAIVDGAKGIILAGVGDGNSSQEALNALQEAAAKGIVVVRASRVSEGYVNRNIEIDDDKYGFVAALDLNPQKARVLTQLLIANGITDPKKIQEAFAQPH